MNQNHNGFKLFLVLAMLTFALTSLQAQNSATNAAAVQVSTNSTLPPEFMAKMHQLLSLKGSDYTIPASFANTLGLTAAGVAWPSRQVVTHGATTSFGYGFNTSRGTDQDIVLLVRRTANILFFRANRDGTLVSALSYDLQTKQITPRDTTEAQADFAVVWQFWIANVDSLMNGN
jgi:hypothetical protein